MDGKQSKVYERLNISLLCNLCVKYAVVVTAIGILPRRWCWPFPSPPLICPTFLPSALIISGILFKNISNIQSAQRTHCVQCLHYVSQALWFCPLQNSPPPTVQWYLSCTTSSYSAISYTKHTVHLSSPFLSSQCPRYSGFSSSGGSYRLTRRIL